QISSRIGSHFLDGGLHVGRRDGPSGREVHVGRIVRRVAAERGPYGCSSRSIRRDKRRSGRAVVPDGTAWVTSIRVIIDSGVAGEDFVLALVAASGAVARAVERVRRG